MRGTEKKSPWAPAGRWLKLDYINQTGVMLWAVCPFLSFTNTEYWVFWFHVTALNLIFETVISHHLRAKICSVNYDQGNKKGRWKLDKEPFWHWSTTLTFLKSCTRLAKPQVKRFIPYLGYGISTQGLHSSFLFKNTSTVGQEVCKWVQRLLLIPATHLELHQYFLMLNLEPATLQSQRQR